MRRGRAMADDQEDDGTAEVLGAALRPATPLDEDAARQAVTAFRAARDAGLHSGSSALRSRRRDDWRPASERRTGRSLKAALAALIASVTLGGVAVAAGGLPSPFVEAPERDPAPRSSASVPPPPEESAAPASPSGPEASAVPVQETAVPEGPTPPGATDSHEALCRAYENSRDGGMALESTAWRRLTAAAGGEEAVPSYCGTLTGPSPAPDKGVPGEVRDGWDHRPPHPAGNNDPDRPRPGSLLQPSPRQGLS